MRGAREGDPHGGEKKELPMSSEVEISRRYVRAVARMLLGHKPLKPGVALLAGGPVDIAKRLELGLLARDSDCDLIHLTFDRVDGDYRMTDLHICAPRGIAVHSHPHCRLSLIGRRAVIVPPDHVRAHFVLTPRELIHKPARPDGWQEGIARAGQRLRQLVERGVDARGQIVLHNIPPRG